MISYDLLPRGGTVDLDLEEAGETLQRSPPRGAFDALANFKVPGPTQGGLRHGVSFTNGWSARQGRPVDL